MDNGSNVDWNIAIDLVVIEGLSLTAFQQQLLKESLEAELGRMFAGRGMPVDMRGIRGRVVGEPISLQGRGAAPVQFGKQVAAAVYNSLSADQV